MTTEEEMRQIAEERRCPYCDTDESDIDGRLGDHVIECQPFDLS